MSIRLMRPNDEVVYGLYRTHASNFYEHHIPLDVANLIVDYIGTDKEAREASREIITFVQGRQEPLLFVENPWKEHRGYWERKPCWEKCMLCSAVVVTSPCWCLLLLIYYMFCGLALLLGYDL